MIIAIGHSNNPNTAEAIQEMLAQCRQTLGERRPGLGLWFTSRMDADFGAVSRRILAQWPDLPLAASGRDHPVCNAGAQRQPGNTGRDEQRPFSPVARGWAFDFLICTDFS